MNNLLRISLSLLHVFKGAVQNNHFFNAFLSRDDDNPRRVN